MIKNKKLLVLLIILLGIISTFVYFGRKADKDLSPPPQASQELKSTLTVGEASFDISAFVGKSALEATKNYTKVEETGTGENAFITSINNISADSKKREFWELIINGTSAQVGAGSYIIQNGDTILWKLSIY